MHLEMSAIDCYRHERLGFLRCPMRHAMYRDGRVFDRLSVYRLLEDVSDEPSFSGRAGDILIGGGSGEARAVCFAVPEIFWFYTGGSEEEEASVNEEPIISYWRADDAFIFGLGFETLGWNPEKQPMLIWLAEHLLAFLVREFPEQYAPLIGEDPLDQDGSIFVREGT